MKQKLQDDLKAAMKSRDQRRMMALRGVLTEISRVEKEVCREANENEIVQVLKRERSRLEEALEFAKKANRADLIEKNESEARVLDGYIPAGAGADELKAAIADQIATGTNQMGPLMKALREKFGGRLDGKMASDLVRQALAPK